MNFFYLFMSQISFFNLKLFTIIRRKVFHWRIFQIPIVERRASKICQTASKIDRLLLENIKFGGQRNGIFLSNESCASRRETSMYPVERAWIVAFVIDTSTHQCVHCRFLLLRWSTRFQVTVIRVRTLATHLLESRTCSVFGSPREKKNNASVSWNLLARNQTIYDRCIVRSTGDNTGKRW